MQDHHGLIPPEIVNIEGEDGRHAMHVHSRNEMGVVNPYTGDRVQNDEALPFLKNRRRLRQQREKRFAASHIASGICDRQAKPIGADGPSGNAPEFDEILRKNTDCITPALERLQSISRQSPKLQIVSLYSPEKDIGISETNPHRYQFSRWNAPSWMPVGTTTRSKSSSNALSRSSGVISTGAASGA